MCCRILGVVELFAHTHETKTSSTNSFPKASFSCHPSGFSSKALHCSDLCSAFSLLSRQLAKFLFFVALFHHRLSIPSTGDVKICHPLLLTQDFLMVLQKCADALHLHLSPHPSVAKSYALSISLHAHFILGRHLDAHWQAPHPHPTTVHPQFINNSQKIYQRPSPVILSKNHQLHRDCGNLLFCCPTPTYPRSTRASKSRSLPIILG